MIAAMIVSFTLAAQVQEMNRLILTQKGGEQMVFDIENVESISFEYVEPEQQEFNVNISTVSVSPTEATIRFSPSELNTAYIARVVSKAELETNGCYISANELDEIQTLAYLTSNPNIGNYRQTGVYEMTMTNLAPSTSYVAVAFEDFYEVNTLDYMGFSTPAGTVADKFSVSNIVPSYTSATMDIHANNGGQAWTYYVMEKEWYVTYEEPIQNCYYGMYNTFSGNQGYNSFSDYLKTIAYYGDASISLSGLEANKEYVVCVYNIDVNTEDPTDIYDWYYYPIEFTTLTPSADTTPTVDVLLEQVMQDNENFYIYVNVKLNEHVTEAYDRMLPYATFGQYYEAGGWDGVGDLFYSPYYGNHSITAYGENAIEIAKTNDGFTYVYTWSKENNDYYKGMGMYDYGICITVFNAEGGRAQNGIIITEAMLQGGEEMIN